MMGRPFSQGLLKADVPAFAFAGQPFVAVNFRELGLEL